MNFIENFLLELEFRYSSEIINKNDRNVFLYPIDDSTKAKNIVEKIPDIKNYSEVIFILNNLVFTKECIYSSSNKELKINYKELYAIDVVNDILFLNENDVDSGRKLTFYRFREAEEYIENREMEKFNYANNILNLFKKNIMNFLNENKKNKYEKQNENNEIFGFIIKENKEREKEIIEKINIKKPKELEEKERLQFKPYIKSDFIEDINNKFQIYFENIILCYDDSFFKSSHINILLTKDNLYLRSIDLPIQIPVNNIKKVFYTGLIIKEICITTIDNNIYRQEFTNASKKDLKIIASFLNDVLLST